MTISMVEAYFMGYLGCVVAREWGDDNQKCDSNVA